MLRYSTYVAPSKPAVSDDLPPGELRRMWSPTAATLICGERDAVFPRCLHAPRWDGPNLPLEVEFPPSGGKHLAGSRRRQDRELQRAGGDRIPISQPLHERADRLIGQRRMVAASELRALRQDLV